MLSGRQNMDKLSRLGMTGNLGLMESLVKNVGPDTSGPNKSGNQSVVHGCPGILG